MREREREREMFKERRSPLKEHHFHEMSLN